MQIDRILYPIESLGPGKRLVIWTVGCSKHCEHCSNQELWEADPSREISVEELSNAIHEVANVSKIDGITFTGGDPLEQPEELLALLKLLQDITDDVLVYTGYTFEQAKKAIDSNLFNELEQYIAVLVDGPYIDALNDNQVVLRGSKNQNIIYFKDQKAKSYGEYMKLGRKIQNIYSGSKLISTGIHNKEEV